MTDICAVCGIVANLKCGGCKNTVYCGKEHQKDDWKKGHSLRCKCYETCTDDILGRHWRATRDIKCGEVIHRESPAVIGPKMVSTPICLGCHQMILPKNNAKTLPKCSKCNWPVCSSACENSTNHKEECKLMASRQFKCSMPFNGTIQRESGYCVFAPLRCLLLKESNPTAFKKILSLEDHLEERIGTPIYTVLKANLVTFIKSILGLDVTEEMILRVAAILDTNTFEIQQPEKRVKVRALYPSASMISHNCKPNTWHTFSDEMQIQIIASVNIPKHEVIAATYTQPLKCTIDRRQQLMQAKCFLCLCERCADPTELGTYAGSIICNRCHKDKLISTDTSNADAKWYCPACNNAVIGNKIIATDVILTREIKALEGGTPQDYEMFLNKYKGTLHDTNTHALQVKYALTQLYGNTGGYLLNELDEKMLERKVALCNELMDVAQMLYPGWNDFRGNLLLDLAESFACQTQRLYKKKAIEKLGASERLDEAMEYVKEAAAIFKNVNEPIILAKLERRKTALSQEIALFNLLP